MQDLYFTVWCCYLYWSKWSDSSSTAVFQQKHLWDQDLLEIRPLQGSLLFYQDVHLDKYPKKLLQLFSIQVIDLWSSSLMEPTCLLFPVKLLL